MIIFFRFSASIRVGTHNNRLRYFRLNLRHVCTARTRLSSSTNLHHPILGSCLFSPSTAQLFSKHRRREKHMSRELRRRHAVSGVRKINSTLRVLPPPVILLPRSKRSPIRFRDVFFFPFSDPLRYYRRLFRVAMPF